MDLLTVDDVKGLTQQLDDTGTDYDALLGSLVTSVSARAESYMNRVTQQGAQTEQLDARRYQTVLTLRATPVVSVTDIRWDAERLFDDSTIWDARQYYPNLTTGLVHLDSSAPISGAGVVQVNYVGGMAADTDAFRAAFPSITDALAKQVLYEFQQRDRRGLVSETTQGHAQTLATQSWLEETTRVLDQHRRHHHR